MAPRTHAAARLEDLWHRRLQRTLRARGWHPRAISFTGYGSPRWARIFGRVVFSRHDLDPDLPHEAVLRATGRLQAEEFARGWRSFVTAPAIDVPVTVTVNGQEHALRTDRGGYIDVTIDAHALAPGLHDATITTENGHSDTAPLHIIGDDVTFGLVSDIDDTVITTYLPRPLIAAWNTFVLHESARWIVPGMAPMYRDLLARHPGAPIFYLSTGAWNTSTTLNRFLKRHNYPAGPLLLTDWGPTNTGWFRSGQEHKRLSLRRLAREFPHIRWVLIGDDGQHDPVLYSEFAREHPDAVRAIGIRQLTPAEQVLSHGIPLSTEEMSSQRPTKVVPVRRAPDGYSLLPQLRTVLSLDD